MVELSLVQLFAIALAVSAALASASQHLLIRKGTIEGKPVTAVFVVMVINVIVLVPIVGILYYPTYRLTPTSWAAFILAGLLASMLGRALHFESISRIGASRTAPIVASWALFASVLGVLILDETMTAAHAFGIVLVIGGIAVIAWETSNDNPSDLQPRELLIGLLIPFGAALAVGWEPILANVGFSEGTPPLVGLAVKTLAAAVGFSVFLWWRDALPTRLELGTTDMRWFLLAGVANTAFLLVYYFALNIAPVNVVTPIVTTNTLFVVVLSASLMPTHLERVTWKLTASAAVVVVGVILVTISG